MAEKIDYVVIHEDGKDDFQCNHCEAKFRSQKSIRTHVTTKHKAKSAKKPPADGKGTETPPTLDVEDIASADVDEFDFDGSPKSTQVDKEVAVTKPKTTYELLKAYEEKNQKMLLTEEQTFQTILRIK